MESTNPFAPPRRNAAGPEQRARGRALARQLAATGAAKGAVVIKLRSLGFGDVDADELADAAIRNQTRKRRIKGMGVILTGAVIVGGAVALSPFVAAKLVIIVGVFGTFFCMLGIAQLFG
ncbi:hypothetical protein Enr13x_47090 [Stieleria neptunia]|uniref:Uncharacterized protein n=1 Tax=Stieleria neptunia TaxID=2527979 RepID=A0A518HVG1_9BACT|nr:hypothetical protein [Stieleria neptunia]QDV44838.1 hypothetical protein Enr13x_47090 [Stieleria neptunia]